MAAVVVAVVALGFAAFTLLRPAASASTASSGTAASAPTPAARTGVVCPTEAASTMPEQVDGGLLVASNQRVHIAVCSGTSGRLYYYGADDRTNLTITLPASPAGADFVASNNGVTYSIAGQHLLVSKAGRTLEAEDLTSGWVG